MVKIVETVLNPKQIKVNSINCSYGNKTIIIKPKNKSFYGFLDWFGTEILEAMCGKKK